MSNRIESMIAKGAGKVKEIKARLDGLVGVFSTLAEQHGEVSVLLKRLRDRPEKKAELWPEIRRTLLAHDRAEMREVYPVLRAHAATSAIADQHDREAGEMEDLIDKVDAAIGDAWKPLYDKLVDVVIAHAAEEEKQIFPRAQNAIGEPMARELDAKFLAAEKQLLAAV